MLRFPFNQNPYPARQKEPEQQKALVKAEEVNKSNEPQDEISPELSMLLSMALRDGTQQNRIFSMLEDIMPYVSGNEKAVLQRLLDTKNSAKNETYTNRPTGSANSLSGYTRQSRQQDLLDVFERYSQDQGSDMINQLRRSMQMQKDFEEASKKFGNLGDMNNAKPEEIIEAMSMFMNEEDKAQIRNMQNMMRLFGSMNNAKPEDLLSFLNLNKK